MCIRSPEEIEEFIESVAASYDEEVCTRCEEELRARAEQGPVDPAVVLDEVLDEVDGDAVEAAERLCHLRYNS